MAEKNECIYRGAELVASSRWVNTLAGMDAEKLEEIYTRIDSLVEENREYCDKGNYKHLSNIFTALALYEMYLKSGKTREEAFTLTATPMWEYVEEGAVIHREKAKQDDGLKQIGNYLMEFSTSGSGYGWEYEWSDLTNTRVQYTCKSCIYAQIYCKYGMPELGPMFCHADDINYGSLYGIEFIRNHTLCTDGQPCDFLFEKA